MNRITIDCPDELLAALGSTPEQFEREAKLALAAKLYELGRVSSGIAARLAGMERVEFLLSLKRLGVSALNLTKEDLEHDLRYARGG